MLELIEKLPDNVVGIVARGRVTSEDCDEILRPAMERTLKRHGKLRLYYEIGSRFPGAGWENLDVAVDHLPQWERIAVVTDTGWVRQSVNALRFLLPGEHLPPSLAAHRHQRYRTISAVSSCTSGRAACSRRASTRESGLCASCSP